MNLVLKVALPYLVASAFFGYLTVLNHGWERVASGGHDVWAIAFFGAGGAAVPAFLATLFAGVARLFLNDQAFLQIWFIAFCLCSIVLAATYYVALSSKLS